MGKRVKDVVLLLAQRLIISFDYFNRNGMMNHAAAGAYGFLLSAAPALLFVAFFVSRTLAASPDLMESLLGSIGLLFSVFNVADGINDFIHAANSGLAGIISVVSILWASRLCARSVQRGLGVVFPGPRSVVRDNIVMMSMVFLAMLFIFVVLLALRLALNFFQHYELLPAGAGTLHVGAISWAVLLILMALITLAAYRFIPAQPPAIKNIIPGVLACVVFFWLFTALFGIIMNPDRFDLLYGAMGRLFVFLVTVFFFFVFFFFGAQIIQVLGLSNALLFSWFRQVHSKRLSGGIVAKLFCAVPPPLRQFAAVYRKGEFVFAQHSQGQEVYYILSGTAGVYLDEECLNRIAVIEQAHFFGEMACIVSENRMASIKAETALSVLILPQELFRSILSIDPDADFNLIKALSERLKSVNQQIMADAQNK